MNQRNAAIFGSVAASVGLGILTFPIAGAAVLLFPVIAGAISKTLANTTIPEDDDGHNSAPPRIRHSREPDEDSENLIVPSIGEAISSYARNLRAARLLHDFQEAARGDEEPVRERQTSRRRGSSSGQGGLKGARGTPDNVAYLRRQERR